MMITIWQVAPSLRMGNTVVVKPSEYTPLSVLALGEVLNSVLPEGILTVVPGDGDLGAHLTTHRGVDKLMFTGSTRTGKAIARDSAETLKRLTLELGGNDAGIVLPDVDPKAIAEGLFWGAFINTGQTCAALKRLYVHTDVYDEVCTALVDVAQADAHGPRPRRAERPRPAAEQGPVRHRRPPGRGRCQRGRQGASGRQPGS